MLGISLITIYTHRLLETSLAAIRGSLESGPNLAHVPWFSSWTISLWKRLAYHLFRADLPTLLFLFSMKFYNVHFLGHKVWSWDWTDYKGGVFLTYPVRFAILLPTWLLCCCAHVSTTGLCSRFQLRSIYREEQPWLGRDVEFTLECRSQTLTSGFQVSRTLTR